MLDFFKEIEKSYPFTIGGAVRYTFKKARPRRFNMTNNIQNKQLLLCVCVLFTVIVSPNLHSYICSNGSGDTFCESGCNIEAEPNNVLINRLIEEGGGYFLNSYSHTLCFMKEIELSNIDGFDFIELHQISGSAIENVRKALETYSQLIRTAEITPYNQKVISILKTFNYMYFMKANGLNSDIFKEVAFLLRKGDVIGVYRWFSSKLEAIEQNLALIRIELNSTNLPSLSILWKLNEEYSNTLLFGQYVAMVFDALKEV